MRVVLSKNPSIEEIRRHTKNLRGCWVWLGTARKFGGYPCIKRQSGHRYVYKLVYGGIPNDLLVLHDCDNKLCVNPAHLHLGTQKDNMQEAKERGRMSTGPEHPAPNHENNGNGKLTLNQKIEIRTRYVESKGRCSQYKLAKEFGVTQPRISQIIIEGRTGFKEYKQ